MSPPNVASTGAIEIVLYASEQSNEPVPVDSDWEGLVALLVDEHREAPCGRGARATKKCLVHDCPDKKGPAWSPVTYATGATRANANVVTVNALVLDIDRLPDDDATQAVLDKLNASGLRYLTHTTHSHSAHDQCLRVVVALSRPVPASAWPAFHRAALAHYELPDDASTKDPARLYFLPSHPHDTDDWGSDAVDGVPLDVDRFIGAVTAPAPRVPRLPLAPPPAPVEEVEIDFDDLVKRVVRLKAKYRSTGDMEKLAAVEAVLKPSALALPGSRDATVHRISSILATTFPANTPVEAAVEMLRQSISAMECEPEGLDHWLAVAAEKYDRAMERRLIRDAERDAVNAKIKALGLQTLMPRVTGAKTRAEDAVFAGREAPTEEEDPDAWMNDLIVRPVKDASEDPRLADCEHNAMLLLGHLPEWRGCLRWNELTKDIEVIGGPLPASDRHTSVLSTAVSAWLHKHYSLKLSPRHVEGPILLVARRRTHDPIQEYLGGLRWDGVKRNARLLIDRAGASTTDALGNDITDHVERITQKWLLGAAVRALRPGMQVDSVLVLEGTTGSGKTTFFRTLAGRFYSPLKSTLDSKDTTLVAARSWIIEMGELASIRKSDRESNNNELTITTDLVRPPYGRSVEEFPRRCVFGATTEDDDWLSSVKGVRRWWPVKVGKVDNSWIYDNRDQLWAEAAQLAREALAALDEVGGDSAKLPVHLRWWLDGEDEQTAQRIASERYDAGTTEEAILAWWLALEPKSRPVRVSVSQVIKDALGATDLSRPQKAVQAEVTAALKNLGFVKSPRETIGTKRAYFWQSSEEMRAIPRVRSTPSVGVTLQGMASRRDENERGAA